MDPLVTAADLGSYLQRPVDDGPAQLACAAASGAVRAYCRWDITYTDADTLHAVGTDAPVLGLPTLRLVDVTAVRVDGTAVDLTTIKWTRRGQLYYPTSIQRDLPFMRPYGAQQVWSRWSLIEVDCAHGYDPIPDEIKLVALSIAARHYTNPEGLQTAAVGSVSRTYSISPLDASLLDAYRL